MKTTKTLFDRLENEDRALIPVVKLTEKELSEVYNGCSRSYAVVDSNGNIVEKIDNPRDSMIFPTIDEAIKRAKVTRWCKSADRELRAMADENYKKEKEKVEKIIAEKEKQGFIIYEGHFSCGSFSDFYPLTGHEEIEIKSISEIKEGDIFKIKRFSMPSLYSMFESVLPQNEDENFYRIKFLKFNCDLSFYEGDTYRVIRKKS